MKRIAIIGEMDNTKDHTFESANRIYGSKNCMPTLPTSCGGGHTPKVIKRINAVALAMRKREHGQTFEVGSRICNSITTAQKDSMYIGKAEWN